MMQQLRCGMQCKVKVSLAFFLQSAAAATGIKFKLPHSQSKCGERRAHVGILKKKLGQNSQVHKKRLEKSSEGKSPHSTLEPNV